MSPSPKDKERKEKLKRYFAPDYLLVLIRELVVNKYFQVFQDMEVDVYKTLAERKEVKKLLKKYRMKICCRPEVVLIDKKLK